jgi:hypothetical protein
VFVPIEGFDTNSARVQIRVETAGDQQCKMRRFAGACRFVFNRALELQQKRLAVGEKHLNYEELCKVLLEWKVDPETEWLRETHSQVLQQSLKDLDRAYKNFQKACGVSAIQEEGDQRQLPVSNWTRSMIGSSCRSWVGCGSGTAAKCSEQ